MATNVLIAGLHGSMGTLVANAVHSQSDMALIDHGLTGSNTFCWKGKGAIVDHLHKLTDEGIESILLNLKARYNPIIVDYTCPDAVNSNAELYCKLGIPFVMGTTGGDREKLKQIVLDSGNTAVIAPNMGKQIVALMGEINDFSRQHESGLSGCKLYIRESHQGPDLERDFDGKDDTSGTADAIRKDFNSMGIPYEKADINKIRLREDQLALGIPEEYLDGHGWHTYWAYNKRGSDVLQKFGDFLLAFLEQNPVFEGYTLERSTREGYSTIRRESSDGTVLFSVESSLKGKSVKTTHNVNGREIYVIGTLDAIGFLRRKLDSGETGKVYSMVDVLRG